MTNDTWFGKSEKCASQMCTELRRLIIQTHSASRHRDGPLWYQRVTVHHISQSMLGLVEMLRWELCKLRVHTILLLTIGHPHPENRSSRFDAEAELDGKAIDIRLCPLPFEGPRCINSFKVLKGRLAQDTWDATARTNAGAAQFAPELFRRTAQAHFICHWKLVLFNRTLHNSSLFVL